MNQRNENEEGLSIPDLSKKPWWRLAQALFVLTSVCIGIIIVVVAGVAISDIDLIDEEKSQL